MIANTLTPSKKNEDRHLFSWFFGFSIIALLAWGALHQNSSWLTAKEGVGYYLGILGGSLMLCMLLYPVRKRVRLMRSWLTVRTWFQMHMLFGILGPVAIIFHANFSSGSLNSQVAMDAMLLVVLSGLIGRYLYRRIHMGLYGQRATLQSLSNTLEEQTSQMSTKLETMPDVLNKISELHQSLIPQHGVHTGFGTILLATPRTFFWLWSARKCLRREKTKVSKDLYTLMRECLKQHSRIVRKLVQLELFSRLFAWWHIVHLPFFILMVVTAIVHVVAVHSY